MVEDCTDAYAWCREHLPKLVGDSGVDVDRFVVAGDSAGGCISSLLAHTLNHPPRTLIDVYGPVDLTDTHFDPIDPEDNAEIESLSGEFPETIVAKGIRDWNPANALTVCPGGFELEMIPIEISRKENADDTLDHTERHRFQSDMKKYMGTNKLLFRTMLHAAEQWSQEEYMNHARSWSSLWRLDGKKTFPPTYLIHGEEDAIVPLHHSQRFGKKLKDMGVDVEEWYEHGGHVFDIKYWVSEAASANQTDLS
jgi:acetyl esterase/lipase